MSGSARTSEIRLVETLAPRIRERCLRVPASEVLTRFLNAAAGRGIDTSLAVRLGLERTLVLADAQTLGLDVERARSALCAMAREARVSAEIGADDARYLQMLNGYRTAVTVDPAADLEVDLPERMIVRVSGRLGPTSLRAEVVDEMISWERAAVLAGRSMADWGLVTLAPYLRR